MAAVVSGGALGLLDSSLFRLGAQGQAGVASHGPAGERVFVNAATGNLYVQGQDELLIGRGPDADLLRTYNSQGLLNDDNGDNWRLGLYRKVYGLTGTANTAGSTVLRVDADGSEAVYTYDAARGKYISTAGSGAYDTLSYNSGTQAWTWVDGESQLTETYDGVNGGRLTQTLDTSGNGLTYTYNASGLITQVTDASGETTFLDYTGTNLTQLRTVKSGGATLTRVRYGYDASNRLSSVTVDLSPDDNLVADGRVYVTSYAYDGTSRRVATMTQSDGTSLAFQYVQVGADYRVSQITDALGRVTAFAYDSTARTTTVTDPLGLVTKFYYDATGALTSLQAPATSQQIGFAYDAQGNVVSVTDAKGNVVTYGYDSHGNRILERDAAGNTVTRVYGAQDELLAETAYQVADPDGAGAGQPSAPLTTRYVYDTNTRLRFVLDAEGRVTEYRYNAFGQRVASIQYAGQRYDVSALAPSVTLTEAQLTAWLPVDRSNTVRADTAYDFRGQVASVTTYAAVDAAGNGLAAGQAVTQFIYDQSGNLLKSVDARGTATADPNDFTTSYVYDGLGRVLSTSDALGRLTVSQYDDANRKSIVTLANGLVRTSTYDAAGELISVLESSGAQSFGETKYFYDADGRLRRTEDPTGIRTHVLYDAAGRKIAEIDGDGSLTEYRYDANNNVTRTIRYATAVSGTALASLSDAQGVPQNVSLASVRPTANGAYRSTWAVYDGANRLVASVDGAGNVIQQYYDGAGRVTDTVRFATAISVSGLGDAPLLAAVLPASASADRLTRSFYDAQGKTLGELDGEGYLVEYKYDAAGRLVETIGYASATAAALRATGTLDQLRPAAAAGDVHSYTLYNARGEVAGTVDGEGYLTETVYDEAGNKTLVVRYATRVTYLAGASLASLRPAGAAQDQASSYAYDAASQLVAQTDTEGTLTTFAYDNAGNLVTTATAANTSEVRALNARYDRQGRLTGELSGVGSALLTGSQTQAEVDQIWADYGLKHAYDAAGRRTGTTDALGNKTLFYYDADGRLVYTVNAQGEVKQSVYDQLGQLVLSVRYARRLPGATVAGLSGGLANAAIGSAAAAIADPARDSLTAYVYDSAGNLRQTIDSLGFTDTQTFNAFGEAISRSRQLGAGQTLDHVYAYDHRGLLTQTVWDPAGINTSSVTQYDAFGRAVQTTDANGNVRAVTYDKLGQVVATRDPLNALRSSTYDAFGRALTQTDALGNTTSFAYDSANRSVTMTTPEGVVTSTLRNRHGEKVSITDGRGNVTSYQYDKNGNLTSVSAPAAGTSTSSYDRANRLIDTVDARGIHTTYAYDAAGRTLIRVVDPGGLALTTSYVYDAKGQAIRVFDANGVETRTAYDRNGNAVSVIVDPHGLHLETAYAYDALGRKLTVTEAPGSAQPRVTQYAYDKLGRLLSERVDPAGLNLTTGYTYDKNDNVVAKTSPNGNVTRYVYDANDRLVYTVDPLGGVTKTEYDAERRATRVTSYANAINVAALPANPVLADIVVASDAAHDRVASSVYDRDGREVYSIDALGVVTQKIYDAGGNVVRKVVYATPIAAATPLTVAGVQAAVQASAAVPVTRIVYDAANRPIDVIDAAGDVVCTYYDASGNAAYSIAYANPIAAAGDLTHAQLQALLVPSSADRLTRNVYDAANRKVYAIDAEGYVKETRYDSVGRITQTVQHPDRISVSLAPTVAEIAAALSGALVATAVNETTSPYADPVQPYNYVASATSDVATPATQTVGVTSQPATVANTPPYTYLAAAKVDVASSASQAATLTVQNTTQTQSGNVKNYSWYRSGGSLGTTSGMSLDYNYAPLYDSTPTAVWADIYFRNANGSTTYYTSTGTDVGYAVYEDWGTDEFGNWIPWTWGVSMNHYYSYHFYAVGGYSGQVNLSYQSNLPAANYTIVVHARDDYAPTPTIAAPALVDNYIDFTDGTWAADAVYNVTVGTVVQPTYVSWATSLQPAGTTVSLKFRAAGSTGAYTNATVAVSGANHQANLGAIGAGNYEYVIEYRDIYGRLMKSAAGTLTTTAAQTTSTSATFNYTVYTSSAAAGASMRYFTAAAQWGPVDHVSATVKNLAGAIVSTAVTYPEAEASYNGEVNLKTGAALADGRYTVELTIYNKDGTITTVAPFVYDAGATRPQQTLSWAASIQPAGTTAGFKYRAQGSTGSWTNAAVETAGAIQQVSVLDWITSGSYEYAIEYRDGYNRLLKSAGGTVTAAASGSTTTNLDFAYTAYASTATTGSSITGYIALAQVPTIDRVEAVVKDFSSNATVSTATTYPEFEAGYVGNVNLKVGKPLDDGRYSVTVTVYKKDGTSNANTFYYEVGPQDYSRRTTTISWSAANQPAGTTAEFAYVRAGQTGETVVTPTLSNGVYQVALTFTADDGVQTGLAEGIYDMTVRYKNGATVVLQGKGQFTAQAGGATSGPLSFSTVRQQVDTFAYDRAGRLIQSTDALGASESYAYDALGNKLSLTDKKAQVSRYVYDAAGRRTFEIDAGGYVTQRGYDAEGNKSKEVRYANTLQGALGINVAPQLVTSAVSGAYVLVDVAKDRVTRAIFDADNRMRYAVDGEGYVSERRFNAFGQETSRIRYATAVAANDSTTAAGMAVLLPASVPASAALEEVRYDQAGREFETVNGEGFVTRSLYDALGHKTDLIRAYGTPAASTTHYAYDAAGRVFEETQAYGSADASTTRYVVNAFGDRIRTIDPRGVELAETDSGWALATRRALGYVDGAGAAKLASALSAAEKDALRIRYTVTQQYDGRGNETRFIDALGATTETTYDAAGNKIKIVDPRGNAGYFYFDLRNLAVLHVDPEGYATQMSYDALGNPERSIRYATRVSGTVSTASMPVPVADAAHDQVTITEYDFRGLKLKVTDAEGNYEQYAYDAWSNKASYRNKLGGLYAYTYDRVGNQLSETLPVGGIVNRFAYDARGNLITQTEAYGLPEQRVTQFEYDKLDRAVKKIGQAVHVFNAANPASPTLASPIERTTYDARGNVIELVAANGARTLAYYDARDRKIAQIDALGGLTIWQYNDGLTPTAELRYGDPVVLPAQPGGVPPAPVNAANVREKRFAYDANNALVETRVPGMLLGEQAAGASGYLTFVQDVVSKSVYDASGNEVQSIDGRGNSSFRYYDKLGQKILEVDAEKYVTRLERDAAGNVVRETKYASTLTVAPSITSDVAALIANVAGGAGQRVVEQDYDRLNRVTERRTLGVETGSLDANGVLTAIPSATARTQQQYNGLGQIVRQVDATGAVTELAYDVTGRKTREQGAQFTDFQGAAIRPTTDFEYDGLNQVRRQLARGKDNTTEADDRVTTYQYDYGYGARLITQTDAGGAGVGFFYDVAGRVASRTMSRTNADGATALDRTDYVYDALDREIQCKDFATSQLKETRYDAYGEMTGKRTRVVGVEVPWQEVVEYDALGRVWKSNAGDGVFKVFLYDANGNATMMIQSAGPDFGAQTLDYVMGLPGEKKYLTISQYDARNNLIDTYQPLMASQQQPAAIQQFLTQTAGIAFSGGAVNVGPIGQVSSKPTSAPVVGSAAITKVTTGGASLALRFWFQGSGTGFVNSPYHSLYLNVADTTAALGAGGYRVAMYLAPNVGNWITQQGVNQSYGTGNGTSPGFNFTEGGSNPNGSNAGSPFIRNYQYLVYKQATVNTAVVGEIYMGGFNGYSVAPPEDVRWEPIAWDEAGAPTQYGWVDYGMVGWPNPTGTTNSSFAFGANEVDFQSQNGATRADRLILQYRTAGSNSGWSTYSVARRFGVDSGWFFFDWSSWSQGSYEIRYTTLDASGKLLNSQSGTMVLGSAPSITQSSQQMGGAGRAFMDASGNLQILEQGESAQTLVVRYRHAGTSEAWLSSGTLSAASVGGAATPGWFVFNTSGLSGSYEYYAEATNASGAQVNKAVGTFTAQNANSVSALTAYQDLPEIVHFISQPVSAASMTLRYRAVGTTDWTSGITSKTGVGAFDWDATSLVSDRLASYDFEYEYDSFDAANARVNKAHGVLRLGATQAMLSHVSDVAPSEVRFNSPQTNATKLVLQYRSAGSTGTYTSVTLNRTSSSDAFVWNVSGLLAAGSTLHLEYVYSLYDSGNAPVRSADDNPVVVNGQITVGNAAPVTELKWVVAGDQNSQWAIHRRQAHNAFGEVVQEIDGRGNVTDLSYNALGLLVEKKSPETDITLANGFVQRGRPTVRYTYDLASRLIAVKDANGNINTQSTRPGSGHDTASEVHADGGRKVTLYDVFGDSRQITDENGRITLFDYDKLGRLTRVVHPSRNDAGATGASIDQYAYDQAGNQIGHTNAQSKTEKTYYDSLGRVTQTKSFMGLATSYTYLYLSSIAGVGGVQSGGWLKRSTDPTGRFMEDKMDVFGRTTWHKDLGGHEFTYSYNHAGWLTSQTGNTGPGGTLGQNVAYDYFANGYLKSIDDRATGSFTQYEYDSEGNRTLEAYWRNLGGGTREYYEYSTVDYDELNRVKRVLDARAEIRYEYDANDNRRRVWSYYHDGIDGNPRVQEFWYLYDTMNRFTLTMGQLSSANGVRGGSATDASVSIVKGATGIDIGYDAGSQRRLATYGSDGHREDYVYTADGYLQDTLINGGLRARRFNDNLGRVVAYQEYNSSAQPSSGRASRYNDDSKLVKQTEFLGAIGSVDAPLVSETQFGAKNKTTYDYENAAGAGSLQHTTNTSLVTIPTGTVDLSTETYYYYGYWDSAKQQNVTTVQHSATQADWTGFQPGYSHFDYDLNGHLTKVTDPEGGRSILLTNDARGQVLLREEYSGGVPNSTGDVIGGVIGKRHAFYYLSDHRIGDVGNDGPLQVSYAEDLARTAANLPVIKSVQVNTGARGNPPPVFKNVVVNPPSAKDQYRNWRPISSADFDQNYEPVNSSYPAATPSQYVVRAGDTLRAIASAVWGDADLWYLIADANGLSGSSALVSGQVLTIPNKVTNLHNSSSTYRVYDPGQVIGNTNPTLPDAPPPPQPHRKLEWGDIIGMIMLIVMIIIIIVYSDGAAAEESPEMWDAAMVGEEEAAANLAATKAGIEAGYGSTATYAATAGEYAALANATQQTVNILRRKQDEFDPESFGIAVFSAAFAGGVTSSASSVATAAVSNTTNQALNIAAGRQNTFDWRSFAASVVSSAIAKEINQADLNGADRLDKYLVSVAATTAASSAITGRTPTAASFAGQLIDDALITMSTQKRFDGKQEKKLDNEEQSVQPQLETGGLRVPPGFADTWGPQFGNRDLRSAYDERPLISADASKYTSDTMNDALPPEAPSRGSFRDGPGGQVLYERWNMGRRSAAATEGPADSPYLKGLKEGTVNLFLGKSELDPFEELYLKSKGILPDDSQRYGSRWVINDRTGDFEKRYVPAPTLGEKLTGTLSLGLIPLGNLFGNLGGATDVGVINRDNYLPDTVGQAQRDLGQMTPDVALIASLVAGPKVVRLGAAAETEVYTQARGLLERARATEPLVTRDLEELTARTGGNRVGAEYVLKSEESLVRKLMDDGSRPINDALRYTITYPERTLGTNTNRMIQALEDAGYEKLQVKNTFQEGARYKGINTTFATADGQLFEVQFHTPESFAAKQATHSLYEVMRQLPEGSPQQRALAQRITSASNTIPIPPRIMQQVPNFQSTR